MRAPAAKRAHAAGPQNVSIRLGAEAALEARPDGHVFVRHEGAWLDLGWFSPGAAKRAGELHAGVRLAALASRGNVDREFASLTRRLAQHGLLEYPVGQRRGVDTVVIEPLMADYWPQTPPLRNADVLALSRFAYLRRRGEAIVLESPCAGALFRICDPKIAAALCLLSTPQRVGRLRERFPGLELLALLVDCQILFKVDPKRQRDLRATEGDADLVLWDFHDLLFHTRSTPGRHANPLGGIYAHASALPAPPAIRGRWPGNAIDLNALSRAAADASSTARLLRQRRSVRSFDGARPIMLAELAQFLDGTARVVSTWQDRVDLGAGGPLVAYAMRPYPSGGASYALELYLAVDKCEGLARGLYHYDAERHALIAIDVSMAHLEALFAEAQGAMGAPGKPQIVITIAARFGRVSWKYSSLAYALILKDVGVLLQTLYLMAAGMGLGGCAIGSTNIDLFGKMTGIPFHVEGPVGQFALGRGAPSDTAV